MAAENTCLDEVFRLKHVSDLIHDDVILRPPEPVEVHVLHHHLRDERTDC